MERERAVLQVAGRRGERRNRGSGLREVCAGGISGVRRLMGPVA